jgi:predicted SAM-dependent methyltransferase|tara:strand:+ start:83 stop:778 length:696 start_codon:yes stop_codon:yes gene_type:complete
MTCYLENKSMKKIIKLILSDSILLIIKRFVEFIKYNYRYYKIKFAILYKKEIKIIIGASNTYQKNWYATNESWLDITNENDWIRVFKKKNLISNILAEHVFEHLTYEECIKALKIISKYMIQNSKIRIAVPDGYNPDPIYLKNVGINGVGIAADDHKQLLNKDVLFEILSKSNFKPKLIEGYDANKILHTEKYSIEDGFVKRSRQNNDPNLEKIWGFNDSKTSLIIDGVKI